MTVEELENLLKQVKNKKAKIAIDCKQGKIIKLQDIYRIDDQEDMFYLFVDLCGV